MDGRAGPANGAAAAADGELMAYARAALQEPAPAEDSEATVLELRSRIDRMQARSWGRSGCPRIR